MVVTGEGKARPHLQQLPGVLPEHVTDLPDRELAEVGARRRHVDRRHMVPGVFVLLEVHVGVMGDPSPVHRWTDLDPAHPAVLAQPGVDHRLIPLILALRRLGPRRGADNMVWRPTVDRFQPPDVSVRPVDGWQHVGGIPARGSRVNPPDNRLDLRLAQRNVVLKLLDADRLVDVPRRHRAIEDPRANRCAPRAGPRHRSPATSAPFARSDGSPGNASGGSAGCPP